MKPAWWLLYGIGLLLVALIGLLEIFISAGALRTILESAAVIFAFVLMAIWRRHNRIALEVREADESHAAHVPRPCVSVSGRDRTGSAGGP